MTTIKLIMIILICVYIGVLTFSYIGNAQKNRDKDFTLTILLKVNPNHSVSFINKMYLDKELKSGKFKEIISVVEDPCLGYSCSNYVMVISDNK